MPRRRKPALTAEAHRRNLELLARLGAEVRRARKRRRWTQREVATRSGLSQPTISDLELGRGGGLSLDTWQRVGIALGRPLRVDLSAETQPDPRDAGHLAIQELVLRLAKAAGYTRRFELPTRPAPSRSSDVAVGDQRRRILTLVECWNGVGDIGSSTRSTHRKQAEMEAIAATTGDGAGYRVVTCWVVRATAHNRALVARYPEVFVANFPGSSLRWVRALTLAEEPPSEPGLVWCDLGATRLFPWRRVGPS